jgi:hypothetical protein
LLAHYNGCLWHLGMIRPFYTSWTYLEAQGVPFAIVHLRIQRFLCPRCGKGFFKPTANTVYFYTQKCVHCGLPKWSGDDVGKVAP